MATQAIITPAQQAVLDHFGQEKALAKQFYLTGGTALAAFYLKHRRSYDLDFFSDSPVTLRAVTPFIGTIEQRLGLKPAHYQHLHDRHIFAFTTPQDDLKVEFTFYPFKPLQKRRRVAGIFIDSLKDIAANKLFAAFDRNEPKDLIDLAFLLQEKFSLRSLQGGARKKFGIDLEPLAIAQLYHRGSKVAFIEPHLVRGNLTQIRDFYRDLLKKSGREILA